MSELPQGWVKTTIGALCDLVNGKAFKPSDWSKSGLPIVRIQNLNKPGSKFNFFEGPVEQRFLIENGELLFAWSGTPGTSFGAHIWSGGTAVLNQHIFKVQFDEQLIDKAFFRYSINQTLDEQIAKAHGGVGLRHVTKGKFEETSIPLPPLAEQRRIVAKLDDLLGCTARTKLELDRIPVLIDHYRQALLAAAFSGKLTQEPPAATNKINEKCWDLPLDWRWVPFSEAARVASNLVRPQMIPDLPHIAPNNVEGGTGRLLQYRTIAEDKVISPKHRFRPGQIVYSKIRPYLRKAVLVDFDGACSADMYPIDAKEGIEPKFLLYWLISEDFARFSSEHEGRTVLPKINQDGLNRTPFPLPPLAIQGEIFRRIEAAFAWLDNLAAEHARAAHLLPKLDQAILAKAFRGDLVPQDPIDEPASALLTRIRAAHIAIPKAKRGRSQSKKAAKPKRPIMMKSRTDADVNGKPYLANKLRELGGQTSAETLYGAADLSVVDFYKQLSAEYEENWLRKVGEMVEAT